MNNNPKTVSVEDIQRFIENDLKTGNLYKVVSRKYKDWDWIYEPYLLELKKNEWFKITLDSLKNNIVVLFCLDKEPIHRHSTPETAPFTGELIRWDLWYKMFIKVLYQNKICLVHAGWLEKI